MASWTATDSGGAAQALIRQMAQDNPTWGQERITNELLLKLGLRVSPRAMREYMPKRLDRSQTTHVPSQRWWMFVLMEHATRRLLHVNVTAHPTAQWTLQQLREALPCGHTYRFLIHDRDSIFSQQLGRSVGNLGLRVVKTSPQTPEANALCERLIGTLRRECFDFLIPLSENHVRRILHAWMRHYNTGRPHMSLGPGIPQPPMALPASLQADRHRIGEHPRVGAHPILGGLHQQIPA